MKKLAALLLVLTMALGLAACGSEGEAASEEPDAGAQTSSDVAQTSEGESEAEDESETLVTQGVNFTVPGDFQEGELEGTSLYYYAADGSDMMLVIGDKDPSFSETTADMLEQSIASGIRESLGGDAKVTTLDFQFTTLDGVPAFCWDAVITLSDYRVRELLVVGLDADHKYVVTFTDATEDGSRMSSFYQSALGMTLDRV